MCLMCPPSFGAPGGKEPPVISSCMGSTNHGRSGVQWDCGSQWMGLVAVGRVARVLRGAARSCTRRHPCQCMHVLHVRVHACARCAVFPTANVTRAMTALAALRLALAQSPRLPAVHGAPDSRLLRT